MREGSPYPTCHVSHVKCHMSVMCHMSSVTCQVSHVFFLSSFFLNIFFYKVVKLVGGGSVINGATLSSLNQTLRIWLGTQFSRPTPELGPLQAEF